MGEQDGCSALCVIKITFTRRLTKKKKANKKKTTKIHYQFNCSFKIMTSVRRVLIEREITAGLFSDVRWSLMFWQLGNQFMNYKLSKFYV